MARISWKFNVSLISDYLEKLARLCCAKLRQRRAAG
jgi:hypothetical protein